MRNENGYVSFTNDDFELQASFDNEISAPIFIEYLRNRYGENKQTKTDFRGMPFMKFEKNKNNDIVVCGKEPATLCTIIEAYIAILNKPIITETDNSSIKIISW